MQPQNLNASNLWNKLNDKQAEKVRGGDNQINAVTTVKTALIDSATAVHEIDHAHGQIHG